MSYAQLTSEERYVIYHLKLCKLSLREIARRLHRHHTTISREIHRHGPDVPSWVYWHEGAHQQALRRRRQPRHHRRLAHAPLVRYVEQGLTAERPPDVIAARLKMEYPNDIKIQVSIETVYRWVYRDAHQGGNFLTSCAGATKNAAGRARFHSGAA